ncbi:MAG: helix-turn-helix transcriptional regulator [Clostridia bacterium]|nr:helix-turn-helix transcriptional regulator [Clostridia bacterium]
MDIATMNHGVPETIERLIAEKGMKKCIVAERAGMSAQMLTDIFANRRLLKMCDIVSLAKALGCTPNDLFGLKEKP